VANFWTTLYMLHAFKLFSFWFVCRGCTVLCIYYYRHSIYRDISLQYIRVFY